MFAHDVIEGRLNEITPDYIIPMSGEYLFMDASAKKCPKNRGKLICFFNACPEHWFWFKPFGQVQKILTVIKIISSGNHLETMPSF